MPLHPQVRAVLDASAHIPPAYKVGAEQARINSLSGFRPDGPSVGSTSVQFATGRAGNIPIRLYVPPGAAGKPLGMLVYFHGGGFVLCNLDTHDGVCRRMCVLAKCIVASVDYRLAPEHAFPAAPDDCYDALCWLRDNAVRLGADPARIAVGGDSAGGNLATVTALRARDIGGPALRGQLLIYPVTDHYSADTPSYRAYAEGYGLLRQNMIWFWDSYLPRREDAHHPYASPLRAKMLNGLPPAWLCTAEFDTLHDEGAAYAAALVNAHVPTVYHRFEGMNHGFFGAVGVIDAAGEATAEAAVWLTQVLNG
jgi:acetyl esterase